jgi:hypothetical protein
MEMNGSFTLLPFDLREKRIGSQVGPEIDLDFVENRYTFVPVRRKLGLPIRHP